MRIPKIPQFTEEQLRQATPQELDLIESSVRIAKALQSPLDLGVYLGLLHPFEHVKIYNDLFMHMINWELYTDGPGPAAIRQEDGTYLHPDRGRPVRKMMANFPVRHTKSLYGSVLAPTWLKILAPASPYMTVTADDSLAKEWSRATQDIILEHPEFGLEIDPSLSAVAEWRLKGYSAPYYALGIGGSVSGKSAFGITTDDVVKEASQAASVAEMDRLEQRYLSAVRKRLTKDFSELEPGFELFLGTRYSPNDLSSRLLAKEPELWFHANFPAISSTDVGEDGVAVDPATGRPDLLGRGPNEALCPQIRTLQEHEEDRRSNPRLFAAMSQGMPTMEGGDLVGTFPSYTKTTQGESLYYSLQLEDGKIKLIDADQCIHFSTFDLAISLQTYADFTVVANWAVAPTRELILTDLYRARISSPQHKDTVKGAIAGHNPYLLVGEKASYAIALQQTYGNEIPMFLIAPKGDKVSRFLTYAAPMFSTYRIFFDAEAPYLAALTQEVSVFPAKGSHDDIVDCISLAGQHLRSVPARKPQPSNWKESRLLQRISARAGGGGAFYG